MTAAKNVREALEEVLAAIRYAVGNLEVSKAKDIAFDYMQAHGPALLASLSATAAGDDTGHWPSRCDWPKGRRFSVRDEPGEHDPCFLVMPSGGMIPFVTHATNGVDQARCKFIAMACNGELQIIDERDSYHDRLDELAAAVASHFGQDIGEHGSDNCPWDNALELLAAQESPQ